MNEKDCLPEHSLALHITTVLNISQQCIIGIQGCISLNIAEMEQLLMMMGISASVIFLCMPFTHFSVVLVSLYRSDRGPLQNVVIEFSVS